MLFYASKCLHSLLIFYYEKDPYLFRIKNINNYLLASIARHYQKVYTKNNNLIFKSINPDFYTFKIYKDSNYTNEYITEGKTSDFAVRQIGTIGTPGARVDLDITKNTPKILYYRLEPLRVSGNLKTNLESVISEDVQGHNQISVSESLFTGEHAITGVTTNTFSYNLNQFPESVSYASTEAASIS